MPDVGIVGQRFERLFGEGLDDGAHSIAQMRKISEEFPGQVIFDFLPNAFHRIQFRTVRRQGDQDEVVREDQVLRAVKLGSIEEDDIEAVGGLLRARVQKVLEPLGICGRQFQEEAFSGPRCYGTIEPEALILELLLTNRLDAFERDPSTLGGNQSDSALILEMKLHFLGRLRLGDRRLKVGAEVFLNASTAASSFLGLLGRATLEVAPSL